MISAATRIATSALEKPCVITIEPPIAKSAR